MRCLDSVYRDHPKTPGEDHDRKGSPEDQGSDGNGKKPNFSRDQGAQTSDNANDPYFGACTQTVGILKQTAGTQSRFLLLTPSLRALASPSFESRENCGQSIGLTLELCADIDS
eukprot:sb/3476862/